MATNARAAESQMAGTGVFSLELTRLQRDDNGMPLSRARAKKDRETEVMAASPQNHMASTVSASTAPAARTPSASRTIVSTAGTGWPLASVLCNTWAILGIASVNDRIRR